MTLAILLGSSGLVFARQAADQARPEVAITSPTDGSTISQTTVDVTVSFASSPGGGNVSTIELLVNRQVVATYENASRIKSGTHTFLAVDLSAFANTGQPVVLAARAYQGNKRANLSRDSAPVRVTVKTDSVAPVIENLLPADGTFLRTLRPTISAKITDQGGAGLDLASITLKIDGVARTPVLTAVDANTALLSFTPSFDLTEGSHTATVDSKDRAGNAATTAQTTFFLDVTPPVIADPSPPDGASLTDPRPSISASWADLGSGIAPATARIRLDGTDVTASSTITATGFLFTPASPLSSGPHTVEAEVADRAGNIATRTWSFSVRDMTPPTLTLSPADGSHVADVTPNLVASYSDSGSGIDPASFKATLDGADVTANFSVGPNQASFTPTSSIGDGFHVFRVEVKDLAGNVRQAMSTFRVSSATTTIGPAGGRIEVTDPATGAFGASLDVPPGALTQEVTFFIEFVAAPPAFPAGFVSVGPIVDFGPDVSFAVPATITIPYDEARIAALGVQEEAVRLLTYDQLRGIWVLMPILSLDITRNLITTQVNGIQGQVFGAAVQTVDPNESTVTASPSEVLADGVSTATVRIVPKGPGGILLGPNQSVQVSLGGAPGAGGPLRDVGNGLYEAFISSTVAQTVSVTVTVNGATLTQRPSITFSALPATFLLSGFPVPMTAGVPSDVTITAVLPGGAVYTGFTGVVEILLTGVRDANGNPLFPETYLAVFTSQDAGVLTLPGGIAFARSGTQQVRVSLATKPAVMGLSPVTVRPGPAAILEKLAGDGQTGATGTLLPQRLAVRVTDLFGNPIQGAQVRFEVESGQAVFER
jgi:hypothetical protein